MIMNKNNIELVISAGRADQIIRDGKSQIAFSGRSNVGKSSAFNTVMERKHLARVSSSPGKTITINFFSVDNSFYLVDLPGYGFAKRNPEEKKKWSLLTDSYFHDNKELKFVLQLIDGKIGPTADDEMMIDFLIQNNIPFAIIATKWDKLNATSKKRNLSLLREMFDENIPIIPFSSLTGEGKNELMKLILSQI